MTEVTGKSTADATGREDTEVTDEETRLDNVEVTTETLGHPG